jgi:hypothetical protein
MKNILVIDDLRTFREVMEDEIVTYARTYNEGMADLQSGQHWDEVWLDHDLSSKKTGYDIAKWIEYHSQTNELLPIDVIIVHSSNPVGRYKMKMALERFYKMWDVDASEYFEIHVEEVRNLYKRGNYA